MPSQTILILRHAEKPESDGDNGVDATGSPDPRSLTPLGWQRAGAWTEIFSPSLGAAPGLPTPTTIFASAPATHAEMAAGRGGSKSRRPLETVTALATKLEIQIDLRFSKGQEKELATALSATDGVVLVCWQHEDIAAIAKALAPDLGDIPNGWPSNCFNVIFKFDRTGGAAPWNFEQVIPIVFAGDRSTAISRHGT
jgi:hypothetical protein